MVRMLVFLLIAGAVVYGIVWLIMAAADRRRQARAARQARIVAPDDDPDFLADLEIRLAQERRRREAEAAARSEDSHTDDPDDAENGGSEPVDGDDEDGDPPARAAS